MAKQINNYREYILRLISSFRQCYHIIFIAFFTCMFYQMVVVKILATNENEKFIKDYIAKVSQDKIVTIDVSPILSSFIEGQKNTRLSSDEIDESTLKFAERLEKVIKNKAKEQGLIIVPKQAVIAGSRDYTKVIQDEVLKGL